MGATSSKPRLLDLFSQFFWIGCISFGGGIIAYERILIVEKRQWITADEFMAYLAISQTMPGLNSVNMAVLTGDHLKGASGALVAVIGLVLPGSIFVLSLGAVYATLSNYPLTTSMLSGIAAGATGLLAVVTYRIGADHWKHLTSLALIIATFFLMSILKLSLVMVLVIMAPIALYIFRPKATS